MEDEFEIEEEEYEENCVYADQEFCELLEEIEKRTIERPMEYWKKVMEL